MTCPPFRLLIVEDEPSLVEKVQEAFSAGTSSARIRVATSLSQYREMVTVEAPDIALLDLSLPDCQLLEEIRFSSENSETRKSGSPCRWNRP